MGTINHGYIDRVKYELECEQLGSKIIITEPVGWNEDQKEFARNNDYDGIVAKFSNSLKFVGDGADYLDLAYELYDVIAKVKLTKHERHPRTDKWAKPYWGYLDMSTRKKEDGKFLVKFNSGGLQEDIKAREDNNLEIDRTTTIDGLAIDPIAENEVFMEGRRIFLKSKWEVKSSSNKQYISVKSSTGADRYSGIGYPFSVSINSHEQAQNVLDNSQTTNVNLQNSPGSTGMMFLANFDRKRDIDIKLRNLSFFTKITRNETNWAFFKVRLITYTGAEDFIFKEAIELLHYGYGPHKDNSVYDSNVKKISGRTLTIPDFDTTISVDEGYSIALEFCVGADLENSILNNKNFYFSVDITEIKGALFAEEDSHFDSSTAKCYLAHDMLNQLTTICANKKKAFYSEYFGRTDLGYKENGPGAYVATSHGFAIRGFNKYPLPDPENGIENLYKPMTTSLRDALSSFKSVFNVGVGIEEVNGRERVRVEKLDYFYNNNITIKLPNQVKKVKRTTATEYYWPSIEIGYEEGGSYEEAQGLDEPNGKTNFTTIINKGKNTFSQISKYRADSYGKEFARRKPFSEYATEDTQYDDSVFLLDLKPGYNNQFLERKWQDDLKKAPTGIFSPETATNLRFSPVNMLLRHGWMIASGLTKYPTERVRYGSSTANSQLKTQLKNGFEYAENDDIINSELGKARFVPEWIEFEHECTFDVMQMVQGTTTINGKVIQNFYGTVQFINENNKPEKGFLFNLKPNGKGQWKVLKSNR